MLGPLECGARADFLRLSWALLSRDLKLHAPARAYALVGFSQSVEQCHRGSETAHCARWYKAEENCRRRQRRMARLKRGKFKLAARVRRCGGPCSAGPEGALGARSNPRQLFQGRANSAGRAGCDLRTSWRLVHTQNGANWAQRPTGVPQRSNRTHLGKNCCTISLINAFCDRSRWGIRHGDEGKGKRAAVAEPETRPDQEGIGFRERRAANAPADHGHTV